MKVLVTGAAGFIGYHVCERLLARGDTVVGLDNLDPSGDVALKRARLGRLQAASPFRFHPTDITYAAGLRTLFEQESPARVVHLAARVGVRPGGTGPRDYTDTNITGFLQVLEGCKAAGVEHLVFASSSSVYGAGTPLPFAESAAADRPLSLYGATKRADELMAHAYSHLHGLPASGLRFFTVYGPWGRPDMAPMLFLRALLEDQPIHLYGEGRMQRDFTYVDDVVEAILRVLDRPPSGAPPFRLLNVGRGEPVALRDFLALLEARVGTQARLHPLPAQPGEMAATWADITALARETGFRPTVSLEEGLARLVDWYRAHASG